MRKPLRILVLEDIVTDSELMERALIEAGIECVTLRVDTEEDFVQALESFSPDLVLADYSLPGYDGASALAHVRRTHPEVPVLIVTGAIGDEAAVKLLTSGAKDYLLKDRISRLGAAVTAALETETARRLRLRAEESLARANRALKIVSRVNSTLVRVVQEAEMTSEICRIVVEEGGFRFAWIGYADHGAERRIDAVASFGIDDGHLETAGMHWADADGGQPTERAVRSAETVMVADVASDPAYAPWRRRALDAGYRSMLALPLLYGGDVLGVIGIYAAAPHAFDPQAVTLLEECAADIGFGIGTARERAARRHAEHRLATIAAAAKDAMIMIDNAGRAVFWNDAATSMFGYSAQEIGGRDMHALIAPERYHASCRGGFTVFRETGEGPLVGKRIELGARRRDGCEFPVELVISAVTYEDKWAAIAVIRDITERKATEARLHQADKMDALGNIAGGIAHDLRNMLLPIIGLTSLTVKELPPGDRQRQRLEKVLEAAERARNLVERIHGFSHMAPLMRETAGVSDLLEEALGLIRPMVPATIVVRVEIACPDDCRIAVDRSQFDTVLMNLASNAIDAIEGKQGTLTFAATQAAVAAEELAAIPVPAAGDYLRLTVSDTGKGMDEETCRRIFDLWFSTKGKGEGAGMGLAVVRRIVAGHGGTVTVASAPGQGTSFQIHLPVAAAG